MFRFIVVLSLLAPAAALAAGGHDSVGCTGCHSLHSAKGNVIFAVAPNTKYLDPKSKQPFSGITALCLACHADSKDGGQGYAPVSRHTSHPFGLANVNPKVAKVPSSLLRENGRFECMGCHDPHPSNPNYKYLRVDAGKKGEHMDAFCGVCHGSKAEAGQQVALFDSMDETKAGAARAAPAAAPAKAPAATDTKAGKK
jgi:predicted CXXCH cytochrome family protein